MPGSTGVPQGRARLRLLPSPAQRHRDAGQAAAKRPSVMAAATAQRPAAVEPQPIPLRQPALAALTVASASATPLSRLVGAILLLGSLLLARATLLQNLAPFHLALAATVLYLLPTHWRWSFLGALCGRLIWAGPTMALFDTLILGGIYATARGFPIDPRPATDRLPAGARPWRAAGGAALATLVGTGLQVLLQEPTPLGILVLVFRTALVALLTVVFSSGLAPLRRLLEHGYHSMGHLISSWGEPGGRPQADQEEWLAAAVLMGALIAALQGLQLGPISLPAVAAACVILCFAAWGGPGLGAAAGAAAGLLALLQAPGSGMPAAAYAVSGLLAGLFRDFGLVGAAGGYAIGILLLAGFSLDPGIMVTELWSLLPAAVLYAVIGYWLTRNTDGLFQPIAAVAAPAAATTVGAATAVSSAAPRSPAATVTPIPIAVAGSMRPTGAVATADVPIAATVADTDDAEGAVETTATPARPSPRIAPMGQMAHLMRDMAAAMQMAEPAIVTGAGPLGGVQGPGPGGIPNRQMEQWLNGLAERICGGCIHRAICWEQEFFQTYQGLSDLIVRREVKGHIAEAHLPTALRSRCPRKVRLVGGIDHAYEVLQAHRHWSQKMRELRRLMAHQLDSLADVARYLHEHPPAADARRSPARNSGHGSARSVPWAATAAPYRVGVARVARDERLVSGDSYLTRLLPGGRLVLILSDGMGAGMAAARESRTAVELLERLLGLDLEPGLAIKLINRLLMARSPEDSYTTLDLALIDLATPQARFVKVGAPPSFLRQDDRVGVIRAGTPPIGIVDEIALETTTRRLRYGDLVVMVTDGVLGAWQDVRAGEEWLKGFLGGLPRDQPRWVATQVIRQALRQAGGEARDDMTALAVKIL